MSALGTGAKALAKAAMEALEKGDVKLATKLHKDAVAAVPKSASRAEKKVVEDVADKISAKNLEMADAPSSTPVGDLMPEDALNRLATPPQKRASGNIGLPKEGGVVKGPIIPLTRENQPLGKGEDFEMSLDNALTPYVPGKPPTKKPQLVDSEYIPEPSPGTDLVSAGSVRTQVKPNFVEKLPEQKFEEKVGGVNLKGLSAGALGTALATQGDSSAPTGQMFNSLPKMDVTSTKVAEAPTDEPKTEKKQKSAPANLVKRSTAAQEGFQEGVAKIVAASENAPNEQARKKYDDTLAKLTSLKTRIDAFDSKERQILAYERIGDMLARAFANLGAGLTAAKQGVTVNPLKLDAADQASRYSDLQALSKQRYTDLGDERDLATKTYTQELKSIEDANRQKFDQDKLKQQEAEAQKDRELRWKIANLEKASRESIAAGRSSGSSTSEKFKIDKEIFDSADKQVQAREKEKQQILASKKLPKALLDAMDAQFPELEGDSTALLQKWMELQDGFIQQARVTRTEARKRLQGSDELAGTPEVPGTKVASEATTPPADSTIRMIAPDGRILQVPATDVPRMESLGAKRK
jgi:hypothetical protein